MHDCKAAVPALQEAERLDHTAQQLPRLRVLPGDKLPNQLASLEAMCRSRQCCGTLMRVHAPPQAPAPAHHNP
jgi:hypothetical protein